MAARDPDAAIGRWRQRRQKLLDRLGDGLLILPTAPEVIRNGDVHHTYRPGSDLFYLTGFPEPGAILVAWPAGKGRHRSCLFVRPRDKKRETWDGRRFGVKGAVKEFGVDEASSIDEFDELIDDLVDANARVFVALGNDEGLDAKLFAAFRRRATRFRRRNPAVHPEIVDPSPAIAEQRWVKDRYEIGQLLHAAEITAEAHRAAMRETAPGMSEYEVQAIVESVFRRNGSRLNGYDSIVASGVNACTLHYTQNDRTARRGELLLLDAGAEVGHYTADITRTWPVGGTFTEPQREIYDIVLRAQKAAVRAVQPGKPWDAPHQAALRWITKGLVEIGLLRGDVAKLVRKGACREWFMHGTSHWLGLDVHDVGPYEDDAGKPVRLRPGNVLTVEPGLYFEARDRRVPKEYRGIGVRIEDDVLVTVGGHRVLTSAVPKEPREVELLCRAPDGPR